MDDEALKKAQEFLEKSIEVKDYSDMSLNQLGLVNAVNLQDGEQ